MKKPKPTKKPVIRTATPGYFFGAMRAADKMHERRGTPRIPTKLPTSLAELRALITRKSS